METQSISHTRQWVRAVILLKSRLESVVYLAQSVPVFTNFLLTLSPERPWETAGNRSQAIRANSHN